MNPEPAEHCTEPSEPKWVHLVLSATRGQKSKIQLNGLVSGRDRRNQTEKQEGAERVEKVN